MHGLPFRAAVSHSCSWWCWEYVSSQVTPVGRLRPTLTDTESSRREAPLVDARSSLAMRPDLESVFRSEYARIVSLAHRVLGSATDAQDVASEVFLSFARSSVPVDDVRGWLSVAAVHTALNHVRSQRRRESRERRVGIAPDLASVPDAADEAARSTDRERVRTALARLPRQQATVLVLRHSGLSYNEVAAHTQLSPSSVGTTLRRAEAALRKELTDDASQ